uniref:Lipid scramblase CLPTM1L n=1 Tax=Takifugu rubripes TaxID=31033 RepID=A0A674NB70_TAKRU
MISVAKMLLGVFVVYMLHSVWMLHGFFSTKSCDKGRGEQCITSYLGAKPRIQLSVFTCLVPDNSHMDLIVREDPFNPHATFERHLNISLPQETRNNGTLYAVVYVHKAGVSPLEDSREVHYAAPLTTSIVPMQDEEQKDTQKKLLPVSHWRPHLSITIMSEDFTFNKLGLPSDVRRYIKVSQDSRQMIYLPLLLVNELNVRVRDLMEINSSTAELPLTVSYEGISLRTFRFWVHLHDVVYSLRQFGFTDEFIDEIKETLSSSNLYVLGMAALLLALKNDIIAWRKKKSMVGNSRTSVLWRCLCSLLIFLHLLEETSLLVLLPVGLGACVEVWKVFKLFCIELQYCVFFSIQASRYLSYLVYPLCISGAIFSMFYLRQQSYYYWLINSLVTGVYALGFLSMAPQLFLNYKVGSASRVNISDTVNQPMNERVTLLCDPPTCMDQLKSVSHLSRAVLVYRVSVNTFLHVVLKEG